MKINELAPILHKLMNEGYGDVELYTHWEDHKGKPSTPEFHLHMEGIHFNEFKVLYPTNPFVKNYDINGFGISPEMSIHDIHCGPELHKTRKSVLATRQSYGVSEYEIESK